MKADEVDDSDTNADDTGAEADGADADQGGEQHADDSQGGEGDEEVVIGDDGKLPDDAPAWAVKHIGKLNASVKSAETERDAAKADADALRAKMSDADVLKAARRSGILPELMTAEEIKTVDKAETLAAQVERLEDAVDTCGTIEDDDGGQVQGYRDADGKIVTVGQVKGWLRKARRDLAEFKPEADALRSEKSKELKELLTLGKQAKAANWKPGAPAQRKAAPGAGGPKAVPPASAKQRPPVTTPPKKAATSYSQVKDSAGFMSMMAKKYGG